MRRGKEERAAGTARDGNGNGNVRTSIHRSHSSMWPVVLQVFKRNRWCSVAKVVRLDGDPVLATVVRHQQGTKDVVSMPIIALEYAEDCEADCWYLRHDRRMLMWRIRLEDLQKNGWRQSDGELYIPLNHMEAVPWEGWAYVERIVQLGTEQEPPSRPKPKQLRLGVDHE